MVERNLLIERLSGERLYHALKYSAWEYESPIVPREGEMVRFWIDSPAHTGPYANARDIIIPDPTVRPLPVIAPQTGRIIRLVQEHDKFGDGPEFLRYTNYVTVQVGEHEFYEICHIGLGSVKAAVGDRVQKGEVLAKTGANGWMTDVRHCHFMVARWKKSGNGDFESLRIRFKGAGF